MSYYKIKLSPDSPAVITSYVSKINNEVWLFQPSNGLFGDWVKLSKDQVIGRVE